MSNKKLKIAILFGGRSAEHEVSIITGIQVFNNIDKELFDAIPVYVSKKGEWFAGDSLANIESYRDLENLTFTAKRSFFTPDTSINGLMQHPKELKGLFKKLTINEIDIAFLCFHGGFGEDGSVQGLLELADTPYVGCGVLSSAIAMDKISAKAIFRNIGIPTVKDYCLLREEWEKNKGKIVQGIERSLQYPLFIKPSNGGSSIGVSKASNREQLEEAVEVAKFYDRRILIEEAVENAKEVNISVMGYHDVKTSECEQPVSSSKQLLSYKDKYVGEGGKSQGMATAKRIIPAPIEPATRKKVEAYAAQAFKVLDCSGLVRIDFLVSRDEKEVYINEMNPIPGSMSFYLWEPKGVKFKDLISQLIYLAIERHKDRNRMTRTFASNILQNFSGTKGAKG